MAIGKKTGGRIAGTPNRAAIKRADEIAEQYKAIGKRLGKEIMSEGANYMFALAARYRLSTTDNPNSHEDLKKFVEFMKLACAIAADVACYESPRLQSTTIHNAPTDLSRLTDAELAELDRISRKAIVEGDNRSGEETTRH